MHTTSFNVLRDYGHGHSFQGDTEIILFGLMRKEVVFIRSNLTWNHFHIQSQTKSWSRGIIEATWNRVRYWRLIIINFLPLRVLKIKLNEVSYIWLKIFHCDNSCFKIGQFLSNSRCMKPYPQMTRSCTHLWKTLWKFRVDKFFFARTSLREKSPPKAWLSAWLWFLRNQWSWVIITADNCRPGAQRLKQARSSRTRVLAARVKSANR